MTIYTKEINNGRQMQARMEGKMKVGSKTVTGPLAKWQTR